MNKKCSGCGKIKLFTDFYADITKKYGICSRCKKCHKAYYGTVGKTDSYKQKKNLYNIKNRARTKKKIIQERGGKCEKCGGTFDPCCYDFHHKDQKEKDFPVGRLLTYSDKRIQSELLKCIMVCANCHRLLHKGHDLHNIPRSEKNVYNE